MPYLCYARKDRRTKPRDPVTTRYVAALFEAMRIDRAVVLDVHNPAAFHNAWRIPAEHLEAKNLFIDHFAPIAAEKRGCRRFTRRWWREACGRISDRTDRQAWTRRS